ncbi:MAG: hypothetical protein ABIT01_07990 [Thermoanaerobaculia bacterium]
MEVIALNDKALEVVPSIEPMDVPAMRRAASVLRDELISIETQLSQRNRTEGGENGRRLTSHEYHAWRARALSAYAAKRKELFRLKTLIPLVQTSSGVASFEEGFQQGYAKALEDLSNRR